MQGKVVESAPQVQRMQSLRVEDPGWFQALVSTWSLHPFDKGLHTLNLYGNKVGDVGASALAGALKSGKCLALHTLNLAYNSVGTDGAVEIAAAMMSGQCPLVRRCRLTSG